MPDHEPPDQPELLPGFRDLDVTPLPAAEIRARGDRLRRRRTTLAVLGAAASVALVAGVVGVVSGPTQQVQPAPGPATTSPSAEPVAVAAIPADFPLRAGWPEGSESSTPTLATVQHRDPCGTLSTSTPGREEAVGLAEYLGPQDDVHVRVLTVYASDYDASQALVQHRADRLGRCPGLDDAHPMPATGPLTSAGVSSETIVSGLSDGAGLALFRGVRVGSAVLYTVDSTLDPVDVDDYAEEAAGTLAPVLEAMVVFASPPGVSDIPADFPLDLDQVAMTGDGGEMRGPSPDEAGLGALELCGTSPWLDVPADRLASTATGPEYADVRELRVYGSADDAVVQMTRLRGLLADCPDEPVESGGRLVHAAIDAITGYDSVTWGDYYTQGLGGGPVQFTRIGRAVLAVSVGGEYGEASLEGSDEQVTEVTLAIAPAMCDYTEAGC